MKKRTFLASIVTIALCLSLIAGSTFALFTSSTNVDIAVDAGRVNITAGLTAPVLYSVTPDAAGTEYDENGKPYSYVQQPATAGQAANTFANGGTAALDNRDNGDGTTTANGVISLVNVTPGDKIEFNLTGANTSDVAVQYRYKIECIEGYDLMSGFVVTVAGTKYASMASYVSAWEPLAVGSSMPEAELALELPVSAGNEYQELDAKIKVSVEAVQANADVSDTDAVSVKYITTVSDETELAAKLKSDDYLHIFVNEDMDNKLDINFDLKDKTIDANGNNVVLNFGNGDVNNPITIENVVIKNIKDTADETPAVTLTSSVAGDITISDSVLYNGSKAPYGAIAGNGVSTKLDVTVDGCKLISGTGATDANGDPVYGEKYGLYLTNSNNVTVRDTEFEGFGSWAIIINGTTTGNVVVSGCTFTNCAGILKSSVKGVEGWQTGSLDGNLTFANNKMYNCTMKDGMFMEIKNLKNTVTFSNNTHNDIVVTVEDMKCDYLTDKYNNQ